MVGRGDSRPGAGLSPPRGRRRKGKGKTDVGKRRKALLPKKRDPGGHSFPPPASNGEEPQGQWTEEANKPHGLRDPALSDPGLGAESSRWSAEAGEHRPLVRPPTGTNGWERGISPESMDSLLIKGVGTESTRLGV